MEVTSDLEHLYLDLGSEAMLSSIMFTPKLYCKLAGEGIGYTWGAEKKYYCRVSYCDKQSFVAFVACVTSYSSKVNLTMSRRISAKAKVYMLSN